ncbi:hypothetical protein RW01021201_089 [Synechococcus phage S-RIM8]|uniref:DUF4815 domain-containing protein n=3 Tax=root TaxID=1 RepID=A0A1D7SAK8_9CAUD|nr:structural protein [Synechococcus phage S-RIM8 A.HR1]YP_009782998.1 hypothetical protein HOQ82_gp156 [Synechococcus phage S-RIM8]AFB15365.1 structural protein [Synechococcus phage S-RIM8 A.HR5]AFB17791.1 hypothetical protein SXEG_00209 [Synechococcus phage S-RIM8 A.HR3]AGH57957.1 structural protein [Synechococcus phage KBS-M-1A]AFB17580.1 structural protein [Synechococcus phage S-RIM8 A.HR1]AOO10237.1 hypothetical protein RW01021201_089 [Synechococcus phage S-RIM8]
MAQNTNLNVSPYYDDFDKNKNFYRVLFRPGFPIQARELTSMQSILQNQVESVGAHLFKDGAMVIPGQVGYDLNVDAIMLQASFLGASVEDYRSQLAGKIIQGLTSGIKAKVLYSISETESDKGYITLYVKYIESGGDANSQQTFTNNEQLVTDSEITFGTSLIEIGSPFAQLLPTAAIQKGSVAYVQQGVYFIRGFFVDVPYQYILLDQYGSTPQYRVGLDILESIVTPEDDTSLNDNAAGTSNYAAPGSHRFKISTRLIKKLLTDDADKDFIELLRINGSRVENLVDRSAYSELERSLATRTYEESGDYTVQDFQITMRENLDDGFNNGVYQLNDITSGGVVAQERLYSVEVGPGAAYVRGYRIKTLSPTYIDLEKPRDIDAAQNAIIPFELGNYSIAKNLYGFPNFSGTSITNAYQVLELRNEFTTSTGTAAGSIIGYARASSLEFFGNPDNTFGNADDQYKLNVFDVQMFTVLQLDSAVTISAGSSIRGRSSGATALVVDAEVADDHIQIYHVSGNFEAGEMITLDGINLDTVAAVYNYQYSDVRQVVCRDEITQTIEFTCDLLLQDEKVLQGVSFTYDSTLGSETIIGLNSNLSADLRPGDRIYFNNTQYVDVDSVDSTALTTTGPGVIFDFAAQRVNVTPPAANFPTAGNYSTLIRYRANLFGNSETSDLLSAMPKAYIKSIADESMVCRRTFDAQTVSANSVSITLPENEQFSAISDVNYTFTVLGSTNGSYPVGSQIPIDTANVGNFGYTTFTSSDRTTIQVNNLTNITSIKVTATISKNVTQRKTKSSQKMFVMKVNKTIKNLDKQNYNLSYLNIYGTRIEDTEISLGLKDAYQLHAVYESLDDNDPIIPSITLVEPRFFAVGSIVVGRTSKARAKVVEFASSTLKLSLVYVSGQFVLGETVTGIDSSGEVITGIINDAEGSVIAGSKVVTDRYYLESSQTGFMYDCSRIVRKKGTPSPIRKLKIVIDYYSHSATGDYFGGQSYLDTNYEDIPSYKEKYLADYLDFRPGIKNLYSGTGTVSSPAFVNCSTFDFKSRVFNVSGTPTATIFDIPKLDSDFRCDYDWYLSRIDKLFLAPNGEFQILKGKSAENPDEPDDLKNAMLLAILRHQPYGFDPSKDVAIEKSDNRRYTMRDIGKIERRLNQVEYYTSLNMLESDTFSLNIPDANGNDRLKNGFFVDDFTNQSKSALNLVDYGCSLDFLEGTCHPSHYTTNIALQINETLSSGIQRTGPIITLPYSELKIIEQPYASRVENVNPFNVFTYIGRIDLTPASDDWIDTTRVPALVTNVEGNFESTFREQRADQNGFAPIQWGAWRTTWSGTTSSSRTVNSGRASSWGRGRATDRITTTTTTRRQTRSGIRTRVVPRIDNVSQGDSIIAQTSVPFIRSRNIDVNIQRMKPRTLFYSFFDGRGVNDYIVPKIIEVIKDSATDARTNATPFVVGETVTGLTSGITFRVASPNDYHTYSPYDDSELPASYSSTSNFINVDTLALAAQAQGAYYGNIQVGEVLRGESGATAVVANRRIISDRLGQFRGSLFIPNPNDDGNPRWATGTRTLRFTTSETDSRLGGAVASSAETEYEASGTLNTLRENILAVRNAELVRDTVTQNRTLRSTRTSTRQVGWWDPLAQSFLVEEEGGVFLTSVDVYFNAKDSNIPISMQIRTMENGYPTTSILPFSDVTITPDQIQTSETGAIATKFTFRAPVYIPESIEHCFVLFSDSNEYQVWISRMGELDISGDRTISEQPYAGVLFKSQNATTWTADQYEDMKFVIYRAEFDTTTSSTVVLNNSQLDVGNGGKLNLSNDPIQTFQPELQLVMNSTTLPYTIGARLYQKTTLAEATIINVTENVSGIILTVADISGSWQSGSDTGGVITNRVVSSKTTATMVVTGASGDFIVGETITGNSANAPTAEVVTWDSGTNTLTLRYVSTNFTPSTETINGGESSVTATVSSATYSGDTVESSAISDAFVAITPTYTTAQRRIRVRHSNHGMHDVDNNVEITGVESEVGETFLTSSISASDTSIAVNDALAFHTRINGSGISINNPGYIKINNEIISYSAISGDGKSITVYERGIGSTNAVAHADESIVECYNLDGIPLIEINKTHEGITSPTLDTYDIATTSIANLGINAGGGNVIASQNIPYEILVPQLQTLTLPKTLVSARVNTITGTSINDGQTVTQNSFVNNGIFDDILLSQDNYFTSPRIICSKTNEDSQLNGAKSLRMDVSLASESSTVSPVLDTDRMSITLVSNRINSPADPNTALLATGDGHDAVYISKIATLTNPSSSIKLMFAGYRPPNTFIKPLYRVLPTGSTDSIESLGFNYFPTGDASIPGTTDIESYFDYEYEISGLDFTQYQIKIVFVSSNQAYTPIIKDLRAIALAV